MFNGQAYRPSGCEHSPSMKPINAQKNDILQTGTIFKA
jgi:hypothetical protein